MRNKLLSLQKQHVISLEDAAICVRKDDGKVKVKQLHRLVGSGALGGAMADIGVDDKFIKEVGSTIEPGHAALFLLVIDATSDKLLPEIEGMDATVLQTSLSDEDEAKLRETFGVHDDEE